MFESYSPILLASGIKTVTLTQCLVDAVVVIVVVVVAVVVVAVQRYRFPVCCGRARVFPSESLCK